jgi:hypothetical protein
MRDQLPLWINFAKCIVLNGLHVTITDIFSDFFFSEKEIKENPQERIRSLMFALYTQNSVV